MRVLFGKTWSLASGTMYEPGDRATLPAAEARAAIAAGAAVVLPDEEQTALDRRTKVVTDQPLMVKTPAPPTNATPEPRGGKRR